MILGEDFKFRDDLIADNKDTVPIEVLVDPYKGIVYNYTTVTVKENEDETATLKFSYNVMRNPSNVNLENDTVFENFIGLILNKLILEVSDADRTKNLNENRKDDTEEFIEE